MTAAPRLRLARGTVAPEPTVVVVEKHVIVQVIRPRVVVIEAQAYESAAIPPGRRARAAYDQGAARAPVVPRWIAIV